MKLLIETDSDNPRAARVEFVLSADDSACVVAADLDPLQFIDFLGQVVMPSVLEEFSVFACRVIDDVEHDEIGGLLR